MLNKKIKGIFLLLQSYGWENVLRPQSIVGCCNLYWKGKSNTQVPVLYVSQTSVFTENPKIPLLREGIKLLKESLPKVCLGVQIQIFKFT